MVHWSKLPKELFLTFLFLLSFCVVASGAEWSPPMVVNSDTTQDYAPLITPCSTGVWVAWARYTSNGYCLYASQYQGDGWGEPVRISQDSSPGIWTYGVTEDHQKKAWGGWYFGSIPLKKSFDDWGIYISTCDSSSWSTPSFVYPAGPGGCEFPEDMVMTTDKIDKIWMVWEAHVHVGGEQFESIYYSYYDGISWSPITLVAGGSGFFEENYMSPAVTADSLGNIWIGYVGQEVVTASWKSIYKLIVNGSVIDATDTTFSLGSPSMTSDKFNRVWVSWVRKDSIWARYHNASGWQIASPVTKGSSPSMTSDPSGRTWLSWASGGNIYTSYYEAGSWSTPILVSASVGGSYPSMTTDNFGNPWVVWEKNGDIYASVYRAVQTDPLGPDDFGYFAYDDGDCNYTEAPTYNWIALPNSNSIPYSTWTPAGGGVGDNDDEGYFVKPLGFSFKYYGISYDTLFCSSNGYIAFRKSDVDTFAFIPTPVLNLSRPNNSIFGFWTDLDGGGSSGGHGQAFFHTNNLDTGIVEFRGWGHWFHPVADTETFEFILSKYGASSGNGEITIQYKVVSLADSCTVGLENTNATAGLQYLYNNLYDITSAPLQNGRAIKFTTDFPMLGVEQQATDVRLRRPDVKLFQNYPNPFGQMTEIRYQIPEDGRVTLRLYNVTGQLVRTLVDERCSGGFYTRRWDGTDESGKRVASGVYFYRLQAGNFTNTKKMILIR
ncbi:MAG: T9SS type A sorting domain-containing protein [Candidatus Edwardsbacteria bacterium]